MDQRLLAKDSLGIICAPPFVPEDEVSPTSFATRLARIGVPCLFSSDMAYHRLETYADCARWGFDVVVECQGCGRRVRFGALALQNYAKAKGHRTQMLRWAGQYFVCSGRAGVPGCGHRGARLSPVERDFDPPPPGAPVAKGEYVPKGIDRTAWARADDRERKRLIRKARG